MSAHPRGALALLLLVACGGDPEPSQPAPETPAPEPGALQVGVARVRMPVPVGIGTAGYGGFGVEADPSPFADIYPATTRVHEHPDVRVMVLSRGEGFEAIFVRLDAVGVFQQLRRALVLELEERLGRDLDDALVIGATHTHSGPGRVIDAGGPFELIADRFFPQFYERLVDAMADGVEAAWADLAPGRIGTATTFTVDGINDRRCEDGQTYENGTLPILAVEREGELAGVMLAYPIHGTVLGIGDLTLSQDVSGGIEQAVADRLEGPALVMMMNSWGADMSPANPDVPRQTGAAQPGGYDQIEAVGQAVADAVEEALPELAWTDTPEIVLETHRTRIDREVIGYEDGVFTYEYGGVYCGSGLEADCDPETDLDPELDDVCIPFTADWPAPDQTVITVGQVGPFALVTFPGEPGTLLAEQISGEIEALGAGEVFFVGYGQDYLGYAILEDDWWQGGYEASGALWGPRQGSYLAQEVVEAWGETFAGWPPDEEPEPIAPFGEGTWDPWVPTPSVGAGAVIGEVAAAYGPADTVVYTVAGADPWLGTPLAHLEHADGSPVLRAGGAPVDSDGLAFYVDLTTDPTYADAPEAASRAFHWQVSLPIRHPVIGAVPELAGSYRIRVEVPLDDGTVAEVISAPFEVTP